MSPAALQTQHLRCPRAERCPIARPRLSGAENNSFQSFAAEGTDSTSANHLAAQVIPQRWEALVYRRLAIQRGCMEQNTAVTFAVRKKIALHSATSESTHRLTRV